MHAATDNSNQRRLRGSLRAALITATALPLAAGLMLTSPAAGDDAHALGAALRAGADAAVPNSVRTGDGRFPPRSSTSHAESVRITYDPRQISYGRILQIYFSVAHDPTQLDRQGPDVGPQYRSAIFPTNAEQLRIADAYIDQLDEARVFDAAIVTTIEPNRAFFPAEDYHQDFMTLNPTHPYIVVNDRPKIEALQFFFPYRYLPDPVLVQASNSAAEPASSTFEQG